MQTKLCFVSASVRSINFLGSHGLIIYDSINIEQICFGGVRWGKAFTPLGSTIVCVCVYIYKRPVHLPIIFVCMRYIYNLESLQVRDNSVALS